MSVIMMYECPKCGKRYESADVYKEVVVEKKEDGTEEVREYPLNYAMIAYFNPKTKQFEHKAYGKDLCRDCMRNIAAAILNGENAKIRLHEVKPKEKPSKKRFNYSEEKRNPMTSLEKEQQEFADGQDDGE